MRHGKARRALRSSASSTLSIAPAVGFDPTASSFASTGPLARLSWLGRYCSKRCGLRSKGRARAKAAPLRRAARGVALEGARASEGPGAPTVGRALRTAGYDATFRVVAGRDGSTF